jgi:D-alanyl-D-alanine carboxypeptidase
MGMLLPLLLIVSSAASAAQDYRPVQCRAARPYIGPALRAAPSAGDLEVRGSLSGDFDRATVERLQAALDQAIQVTGAQAVTVAAARPGQGSWSAVRSRGGAHEPQRFWWASVGKMVTAAVVLQFVEEGRLSLDTPVARFVPGVPNGEAITIAHLLEHSSGLFSANEDRRFRARPHRMALDEQLAIVRRHGPMFCPGERWRYSNTGYSLLGAVIEQIERRPYAEVATRRVLAPLGATSLRILTPDDAGAGLAPLAPSDPHQPPTEPTWPGPAGALAGRAEDVNRLLQALLGGQTARAQLQRLYPMFDSTTFYGRGLMVYEPPGAGIYWIGHSGGSPGAKAITIWSPRDRALVSVALTGDGSAEGTANLLLRALPPL